MDEQHKRRELITGALKRPIMLLWVMVLPQLLLMLLNVSAWTLVQGDMSAEQLSMSRIIGACEVGVFLLGIAIWFVLGHLKREIDWRVCLGLMLVHAAYLWLFTAKLWGLLPAGGTVWMLQPTQLMYYQYTLIMPAIFYSAIRLSGFGWNVNRWVDTSVTAATIIGVPVLWYCGMQLFNTIWSYGRIPYVVMVIFLVISTILVLVAFLRLLLFLHGVLIRLRWGHIILPIVTGLLAPLGALSRGPFSARSIDDSSRFAGHNPGSC
jgi:hypothetical protein